MGIEYRFEREIVDVFEAIKRQSYRGNDFCIPVYKNGTQIAILSPITKRHLDDNIRNDELVRLLSEWRRTNAKWYPTVFKVTYDGTRKWLRDQVIGAEDRILFMVKTMDGNPFGHMGFYRGEADNFIRGRKDILNGGMTSALRAMLNWAFIDLDLKDLYLRVFSDNTRAIAFYDRCGFRPIYKIPLKKYKGHGFIRWEESHEEGINEAKRYFSVMHLKNPYVKQAKGAII